MIKMQTIFNKLQAMLQGNMVLLVGYILLGMLLFQGLLLLYFSFRRIYFEREQQQLSRERLRLLIKVAAMQCHEAEQTKLVWNGYRKFQVAKKVNECREVCSFYLKPHDGKPLPA